MGFFDEEKNVNKYIEMAEGYDGKHLIDILKNYLNPGASLLELGMGPGKDLDMLKEVYRVTGSDLSHIFIERYLKEYPGTDLLLLDAIEIKTERRFDAIYSNKVLHHLTKDKLETSIVRQKDVVAQEGILLHSFWKGDKTEEFDGLFFQYYLEEELESLCARHFEILQITSYTEMEDDDSILVVLKNSHI